MKTSSKPLLKAVLLAALLALPGCADLSKSRAAYQVENYEAARKDLEELARRGFPEAMTKLGEMYVAGNGMKPDPQKGLALFRQAEAQEKYPPAIIDIGQAYRLGVGVPKSAAKAKEYFERALALGDADAYAQLGLLEQDAKHYATAEDYFNKAINAGDGNAWRLLGDLRLAQGKSKEAEDSYNKAISAGDISAYTNLGHIHMKQGKYAEAEKDFENSVSTGNLTALLPLGDTQLELGKYSDAEASYKQALKTGNTHANIKIGNMYRNGNGRPIDGAMALYWYYKARKEGVPDMDERIMHQERRLLPDELARALKLSAGKTK
jgi:TPR repeat protein